jgi:hypothetical protein
MACWVISDSTSRAVCWGFVGYFLLQRSSMRIGEENHEAGWLAWSRTIINLLPAYKRMPRAPTLSDIIYESTSVHHG